MKTELSIWSAYYIDLSPEEAVLEMKKQGLTASELSDEHGEALLHRGEPTKVGRAFKAFLEEQNFSMPQGHLWLKCKICSTEEAAEQLLPWLDLYDAIGVKNAVLHLDSIVAEPELTKDARYARNLAKLKVLEAYMQERGLKLRICLENLSTIAQNAEELCAVVDQLDQEHFGICLDTGHLNLCDKDQRRFILTAGKRLKALHIADNEGERDQHMMPFGKGNVNFGEVVQALREIDYEGLFNLEIPGERLAPLEVRGYKVEYVRKCYEYLMSH